MLPELERPVVAQHKCWLDSFKHLGQICGVKRLDLNGNVYWNVNSRYAGGESTKLLIVHWDVLISYSSSLHFSLGISLLCGFQDAHRDSVSLLAGN